LKVIGASGGIVMAILADAGIHEIDKAPVVNGLIALVKIGELAVNIRALTGHFTSKRLTYAPPSGALLDDIRRAYGDDVYPGAG
jgi:allantoin racemase